MHAQLQGNKTFLKIPLRKCVITPAVHHLSEGDHALGAAAHCPGSNDSTTTKSRKQGCTAVLWDRNTNNEGRKTMLGSGGWGGISFLLSDEVLNFPLRHKDTEPCQKTCRCVSKWHADFHCTVIVALVKRKQKTKIPSTMQVFLYLSHDFYIPSTARCHVHKHLKNCQGPTASPVYIATYPYWSGWCIKGAWVLP